MDPKDARIAELEAALRAARNLIEFKLALPRVGTSAVTYREQQSVRRQIEKALPRPRVNS